MTDPRLHSREPIDDEIPFQDAEDVPGDERPEDEDAVVAPAAAERNRKLEERDVDQPRPGSELPEDEPR